MKKLITIAILLALLAPNISLATYKPATLSRGSVKVVVRSQSEASHFFALGYKLYTPGMLGITIPAVIALYEDSLASKISDTATSMTLVNGRDNAGTALNGFYGFIIDEGSSNEEFVTANCVSTACTGMTRGISLTDGKTSVTALKFEHRRAGSVKITNYPQIAIISRILSGQESTPGGITFATGTITGLTTTPDSSSTSTVANVDYVNNVATSGAPNISETIKGIGEIATQAEASAGTSVGGTGARLLLPASMATSTGLGGAISIPVTGATGLIAPEFYQSNVNVWSATNTFTGSTTIDTRYNIGAGFTHIQVYTASTTWTKPTGVTKVRARVVGGGGNGGACQTGSGGGSGGGGGGGYAEEIIDVSATTSVAIIVGGVSQTSSFGTYLQATGGSTGSDNNVTSDPSAGGAGGVGSGGDINVGGQPGTMGMYQFASGNTLSGNGGGSVLGGGGAGFKSNGNANGNNGVNYGGGGSGCTDTSGSVANTGGIGATGVVIIEY